MDFYSKLITLECNILYKLLLKNLNFSTKNNPNMPQKTSLDFSKSKSLFLLMESGSQFPFLTSKIWITALLKVQPFCFLALYQS